MGRVAASRPDTTIDHGDPSVARIPSILKVGEGDALGPPAVGANAPPSQAAQEGSGDESPIKSK